MPTEKQIIASAMSILGKRKSKAKARSSRENGKLGGITKVQRERWEQAAQRRKQKRAARNGGVK